VTEGMRSISQRDDKHIHRQPTLSFLLLYLGLITFLSAVMIAILYLGTIWK
jgi:hypothetical protein